MDKVLTEIDYETKRKRCSYGDPQQDNGMALVLPSPIGA